MDAAVKCVVLICVSLLCVCMLVNVDVDMVYWFIYFVMNTITFCYILWDHELRVTDNILIVVGIKFKVNRPRCLQTICH